MILDDKLVSYVLYKKRTISEVREKCRKLGFTEEYIDEIIEYLVENGYLDDEKYVMKYKNIDECYKNSIPLYSYAFAQFEYNAENRQ